MKNITRSRINEHYLKETVIRFNDLEDVIIEIIREEFEKILEFMKTMNNPQKVFTIEELAKRHEVSRKTVYNWIDKKIIIGYKLGNKRLFSLKEIETKLTDPRYWEVLEAKGLKEPGNKIF